MVNDFLFLPHLLSGTSLAWLFTFHRHNDKEMLNKKNLLIPNIDSDYSFSWAHSTRRFSANSQQLFR